MPTYRNDSTETKHMQDINGVLQKIAPGESLQTYEFLGTGWTQTDEAPVFNPVAFSTEVTLTADGTGNSFIAFDPLTTKTIRIQSISDAIESIHVGTSDTVPAIYVGLSSSTAYTPEINNDDGKIRKLVFKGSGTCVVVGLLK